MLDNMTKKKIDDARDILVGKVPVPSTQVEQITIALIYKFMYDMDNEAIDMGGNPKFFTGDYTKYGWNKLFAPGLSGEGRVILYQEALRKIPQNPDIPPMFREVFKNSFLPYRDPITLKLFLKCIDEFTYEHSEKLGDAFEYLLAVLGSQGDAGQFRTPRHIIDFMVELVDPKKDDSILDPACGTAGFLISAYKHILKTNSSNYDADKDPHTFETHNVPLDEVVIQSGKKYSGDLLTPDQRAFLHNNIKGYDIASEMVRLSLVNMYLHGFNTPQIFEYDTLTSTDRWNEYANVILANPPFMTPKGGIRPHQKFSIQAKRSEVLFVDYIIEHLTNQGRACLIVPDSIIYQTMSAHKNLRQRLVNGNNLVGIISLPAGVFNPYSADIKTSILWIDKNLSKRTNKVLFLRIDSDGYDLGTTRKPVLRNDLPKAFDVVRDYKKSILEQSEFEYDSEFCYELKKDDVRKNPYYSLFIEEYRKGVKSTSSYPLVKLGRLIKESNVKVGERKLRVWSVSNELGFVNSEDYFDKKIHSKKISGYKMVRYGYFAFNPSRINVGSIAYNKTNQSGAVSPMYKVFSINQEEILPDYLLLILKSKFFNKEIIRLAHGAIRKQLSINSLKNMEIPLPSIAKQKEILTEIDTIKEDIERVELELIKLNSKVDDCIDSVWFT